MSVSESPQLRLTCLAVRSQSVKVQRTRDHGPSWYPSTAASLTGAAASSGAPSIVTTSASPTATARRTSAPRRGPP